MRYGRNNKLDKQIPYKILSVSIKFLMNDIKKNTRNLTEQQRRALDYYSSIANMLRDENTIFYDIYNSGGIVELLEIMSNQLQQIVTKAKNYSISSLVCAILEWSAREIESIAHQIRMNSEQGVHKDLIINLPENLAILFKNSGFNM